jgi:crotonobetainyl-CoA:carnitine CoA-transferase CaiB-like acyl-CoA transferase
VSHEIVRSYVDKLVSARTPPTAVVRRADVWAHRQSARSTYAWRCSARRIQRGFTWGAVRAPEQLLDDPHLHDRGFWKQVEHPELGRCFTYPGETAIYNPSPWRISRRAPLIGEHNAEILCGELGLSAGELTMLMENHVI